jgi:serine/threonine protein phosphatase PrpC
VLNVQVKYAYVTQRGYYPDTPDKANQDTFIVRKDVGGDPEAIFFGVFDGHGTAGTECAKFACEKVSQPAAGHWCSG